MTFRGQPVFSLMILWLMCHCVGAQSGERWVFEGLVTESDPTFAPALQSGWVLAGSFLINSLELEEQFVNQETRSGRIVGGITEAEMTVDLYHQVLFEAAQQPGLAGFDFQDNNIEENGRDLLGWFFPLKGKLGETEWTSTWLQIWLMDPEGKMISHTPVKISPYGIEWKSGWFRLTFTSETGETAHADGRMELFAPESQVEELESSPWYAVAADLSRQLMERDSTITVLQRDLSELKDRLDGLRRMVDLLVEERTSLQEDNELLKKRAEAADPQMVKKLAEITAEKSLLESRITDLSGENDTLQLRLSQSEQERYELMQNLADLEKQLLQKDAPFVVQEPVVESIETIIPEAVLLPPVPEPEPTESEQAEPQQVEMESVEPEAVKPVETPPVVMTEIDDQPIAAEDENPPVTTPEVKQPVEVVPGKNEPGKKWSSRRFGPRKFR